MGRVVVLPQLTRNEAIEMQEALIGEFSKPEFQANLRLALKDTCSQETRVKIQREIREMREEVGARFGFARSKEGVDKSTAMFTPEICSDPEVIANCHVMFILLYPQLQEEVRVKSATPVALPSWDDKTLSLKARAELAARHEEQKSAVKKFLVLQRDRKQAGIVESVGRHWDVIGGGSKGIIVRRGEDLNSPALPVRLANNATIEELELIGNRLHYKKLFGEGPNYGWISVAARGAALVCPAPDDRASELPAVEHPGCQVA
mmetsp:Transcript_120308/g.340902  ORF Transcript_120308/g.340902 Transcript_120308/m.340902 type:complete len:262 (+) Transcript_120308:53-838(+)